MLREHQPRVRGHGRACVRAEQVHSATFKASHQLDLHLAANQGRGPLEGRKSDIARRVEQSINLRTAGLEQGRQLRLGQRTLLHGFDQLADHPFRGSRLGTRLELSPRTVPEEYGQDCCGVRTSVGSHLTCEIGSRQIGRLRISDEKALPSVLIRDAKILWDLARR